MKRCSSEGVDGSGSFRVSSGLAIYCKVMLRHSPCVHHLSIQALALTVSKPIKLFSFTFVKSGCLDLASARFGFQHDSFALPRTAKGMGNEWPNKVPISLHGQ